MSETKHTAKPPKPEVPAAPERLVLWSRVIAYREMLVADLERWLRYGDADTQELAATRLREFDRRIGENPTLKRLQDLANEFHEHLKEQAIKAVAEYAAEPTNRNALVARMLLEAARDGRMRRLDATAMMRSAMSPAAPDLDKLLADARVEREVRNESGSWVPRFVVSQFTDLNLKARRYRK